MTVYFASSEDIDFSGQWLYSVTTGGYFDANYARGTVAVYRGSAGHATINWGTELSSMYISYRAWFRWFRDGGNQYAVLTLKDDSGNEVFKIHPNSSSAYRCYTWDGGWVLRDTMSIQPANNTRNRFTIKMVVGTSGGFEVYLGDTLVASWSGDTKTDSGATGVSQARLSNGIYAWYPCAYSEVIVADSHTINMRVATLVPNADGTNTAWVNGYAAVDEVANSAADIISSPTADEVETMNLSNYGGSASLVVRSVHVSAKAIRGASGPQNLQLAVREGATEGFSASKALSEAYVTYREKFEINPDTGVAWTLAELDSLEAGVKSIT